MSAELDLYIGGERAVFWHNLLVHTECRARAICKAQQLEGMMDFVYVLNTELSAVLSTHSADCAEAWMVVKRRLLFPNQESLVQFVLTWS